MTDKRIQATPLLFLVTLLTACGGGGGSDSGITNTNENTADNTNDQTEIITSDAQSLTLPSSLEVVTNENI
ncbi:hypothetical protein LCGC14_2858540 [marine sediment metagenome]|uniref:Uncharacterized protein n=1 Tax=marine sediment metagenome TaxID=412755 RepID=A0A0F8Y6B0_9ZZZZ